MKPVNLSRRQLLRGLGALGAGSAAKTEILLEALVEPLRTLGEPVYLLDSNPTVERIAKLIFDAALDAGLPVVRVRVWETPSSFAEYARSDAAAGARAAT